MPLILQTNQCGKIVVKEAESSFVKRGKVFNFQIKWLVCGCEGTAKALSRPLSLSLCVSLCESRLWGHCGERPWGQTAPHIYPQQHSAHKHTHSQLKRDKLHYYSTRITTWLPGGSEPDTHTHTHAQSAAQTQRGHTGTQKSSGWWAKCWGQAAVMNLRFWEWTLESWNWAGRCVLCLRRWGWGWGGWGGGGGEGEVGVMYMQGRPQ